LAPGEPLQSVSEGKEIKSPVARRHARGSIEGRRAGKQARKPREQKQRLLSAHATAERVDATTVDAQPGDGMFRDQRHPGEVANLSWVAPREERQPAALALGIDDGEAAVCRQVSPAPNVRPRADTTPVRRD